MRLLITSDSHGRKGNLFDIIEKHIDDTDLFISLGDCNDGDDFEDAELYFGERLKLKRVAGNTDWYSTMPTVSIIDANGKKVMFCHGHTFNVKFGYDTIINEAKKQKVDVVLFGHTHTPYRDYIDGIHFLNPGAVCDGRYGMVDITKAGIVTINASL